MKKYNLKPECVKRIRPNMAWKRIEENVQPNLVKRQFKTRGFNQIWCTDITYLIWGNKERICQQSSIYMIVMLWHIKYPNSMTLNWLSIR